MVCCDGWPRLSILDQRAQSDLAHISPSKHETLNQCWVNAGPTSTTSARHWPDIGSMSRVCWAGMRWVMMALSSRHFGPGGGRELWIPVMEMKWNESGFRPPLCTYRLNWARRTSWGWWDDWDDTVLQTQDSKFEPWRSEAEHATSRSRRLPTILTFTRGWGRNIFVSFKPPRPNSGVKGSGANHYPKAPALSVMEATHNAESVTVGGEETFSFFETRIPYSGGQTNLRTKACQAGTTSPFPPPSPSHKIQKMNNGSCVNSYINIHIDLHVLLSSQRKIKQNHHQP